MDSLFQGDWPFIQLPWGWLVQQNNGSLLLFVDWSDNKFLPTYIHNLDLKEKTSTNSIKRL